GTTVATIADMTNLIFKGKVDETEVGLIDTGMPVNIFIGALPEINPTATIEYISPKATEENGASTFEVKAAIVIPDNVTLRAGYSANASVILSSAPSTLTIPEGTIEFKGDSTYVYILTDSVPSQKWERVAITTGISDGMNIEIKSGIDANAILRGNIKE
ncbi:MAG: HlyD family efflux transporter periplasmic adaptor subunit, partial [Muribaculaceae bacterium]|nr:HlyD family efflux transporter periplasmic adaptor subunit [Muribaculaceae bacterium]